jgi:hypothetical protein
MFQVKYMALLDTSIRRKRHEQREEEEEGLSQ